MEMQSKMQSRNFFQRKIRILEFFKIFEEDFEVKIEFENKILE